MDWIPFRWHRAWKARFASAEELLADGADILRRWALSFSRHVLAPGDEEPPDDRQLIAELTPLAPWLARFAPGRDAPRRGWPLGARRRRPERRLGLERRFGARLWPLAGERAWRQETFARQIAERVLAVSCGQHLVVERRQGPAEPAPWPTPRIAPWTWWLLLVGVAVPALRRSRRWRHRALARRLDRVGREILDTAGEDWAGFWDQWLVGEVLSRLEARPTSRIAASRTAWHPMFYGMPWLRHFDELAGVLDLAGASDAHPAAARDDGGDERPEWLSLPSADPWRTAASDEGPPGEDPATGGGDARRAHHRHASN